MLRVVDSKLRAANPLAVESCKRRSKYLCYLKSGIEVSQVVGATLVV